MIVRLTPEGREKFNVAADVKTVSVSVNRAFAMMDAGMAVKERRFMAMYAQKNGLIKPIQEDAEPKKPTRRAAKTKGKTEK